ncbi:hypothetical protein WBQ88_04365 [Sphingopyxis sp. CCNWLW253]|uniref:hypothetical protein n=2 Tax=Sphingopyxis TaxID=165697 RepID=UPI003012AF00
MEATTLVLEYLGQKMVCAAKVASLAIVMAAVHGMEAHAETDKGDVAAGPIPQGTAPPGVIVSPDDPDEIVVTAARRGEAEVPAETEFGEGEIASRGADSIQDLLTRLAPFIDGSGEEPVILINGKPAGFDRSILSYPAEALDRLAVLKPEAAALYGERAGKRVVNLVLKKKFAMLNADAGADFATAGGRYGGTLSIRRTAISGDTRWNAQARVGADSAFRKTARSLPRQDGVFDSVGFISVPGGGEIDPSLSLAAGERVTAAAIPAGAQTGAPRLDDFAATAGDLHPVDPSRFETLQSSRRNAALGIGVTRPLGDFSVALNLDASRSSSDGLRGLPMASVVIPAGHPWSPFAGDVVLTRPFAGERALRADNGATSLGASLTLTGNIRGWQTSVAASYARSWADNFLESGVDIARAQQLIDDRDPAFNPYGLWDEGLMIATRTRTKGENLSARLNVRKAVIDLPAGPLTWNLTANTGRNRTQNRESDASGNLIASNSVTRNQSSGLMSLSIPISRGGGTGPGWLGDLTVDLTANAHAMTNSRLQKGFGGNISWSPWPVLQLRGGIDYADAAPSFDQLDGPIVTTINRMFDYARQEIAEPVWITGGNPNLKRGRRQSLAFSATVRPLGNQILTLNFGYRQSVAKGGLAAFPELTPAIEAAFPERVTRDAAGRLVAVDARAINLARDTNADLSTGVALRLALGGGEGRSETAGDPLQLNLSLNHGKRLKSELLTRPGVPVIDQLRAGGQSRHSLSFQASIGRRGIGGTLSGNWSSPGRLRGGDEVFVFKPPLKLNLSAFIEPDRIFAVPGRKGLMSGLKLSVDINDLLNGYRRVTREDGTVPAGYSRDEIEPLGRVVRLTVRKKF